MSLAKLFRATSLILVAIATVLVAHGCDVQVPAEQVRFGVSPFQDTYLPVLGERLGWYQEEGLDVRFTVLGWTEVMEALSAGQIDLAINNMSSVIATHERNPNLVYWYGFNTFDNGFALMVRPGGPLRPLEQILADVPNRAEAIRATAAQLKGRTVITTSNTDMEQGVAAAALRGGLDFLQDVRIIDLNPDEGLAAFLRGEGDAFIGGIPQRTRAGQEGMVEMLTGADLGPAPINGIVTTRQYAQAHEQELLKILKVWFRIVNYVDSGPDSASAPLVAELNQMSGANFTVADFQRFWNNYEHYPASPEAIEEEILSPVGRNYWKARWDDCNRYFAEIKRSIPAPVEPDSVFWMPRAHESFKRFMAESESTPTG